MHTHDKRAFSLVELSIVLVILGLLVGGVLSGQSLIRAAELRSVGAEYQRYLTATHSFRDKYFALPGDMTNASSFWGLLNATPATCQSTLTTTAATCNGDGNGKIDISTGSNEPFRLWQHLSNAGLIEGTYQGAKVGASSAGTATTNAPSSKIASGLWYMGYIADYTANNGAFDGVFDGSYGNAFRLGKYSAGYYPGKPLLKPEEAWNIDNKLDDGIPSTGKVVSYTANQFYGDPCTTAAPGTSSNLAVTYLLTGNALGCGLIFRNIL